MVSPPEWFEHTQKEGVLWLNTALTFSSKEIPILKLHTEFWKPIITAIFDALIKEMSILFVSEHNSNLTTACERFF